MVVSSTSSQSSVVVVVAFILLNFSAVTLTDAHIRQIDTYIIDDWVTIRLLGWRGRAGGGEVGRTWTFLYLDGIVCVRRCRRGSVIVQPNRETVTASTQPLHHEESVKNRTPHYIFADRDGDADMGWQTMEHFLAIGWKSCVFILIWKNRRNHYFNSLLTYYSLGDNEAVEVKCLA